MRRLAAAAAAALVATATPALAESPRGGSFEIGVGTYRPNIDSEFATAPGPYEQIFGGGQGWMFQLGISRALFTSMGSLEVGVRTGYFQKTGKGLIVDTSTTPPTFSPSGDETALRIIPTSLAVTYRLDLVPDRFHVPLAPYGRVALERYNWWVTDGAGKTVEKGATNGWSITGGVGLLLDFFDPGLAREMDRESGVNHTYLFFEVTRSTIDDFGSSKSWDLSSEKLSLTGGLLFVF